MAAPPPFSPQMLERFDVHKLLGEGAAGRVYLARQRDLKRTCAIKTFAPAFLGGTGAQARFLDEGRLLARVEHPNVLRVFDTGIDGTRPYLVLEYVDGVDLRDLLGRALARGGMEPREACRLIAGIAAGLAAAHEAGVVHRDLKPENVLVTRDGVPKVADFGFALQEGSERSYRTQKGVILGTPHYLSPEQIDQMNVTSASDVYALGIMLFELLVGRPPHDAETDMEILVAHTTTTAPPPSSKARGVPPRLDEWTGACLEHVPSRRPSAAEVAAVLRAATEDWVSFSSLAPRRRAPSPEVAPTVKAAAAEDPTPRALPLPRVAAACALVLALGLGLRWALTPPPPPREVSVQPLFDGLLIRWRTAAPTPSRVGYRRQGDDSWQQVLDARELRDHRIALRDLAPGQYQAVILQGGREVPIPGGEVRALKLSGAVVTPTSDTLRTVQLDTSLPVEVAVTDGREPADHEWTPRGTEHQVPVSVPPEARWLRPTLYLRDPGGEVRVESLGQRILGYRALATYLTRELGRGPLDVRDFRARVVAARKAHLEDARPEVREIAARLRAANPDLNERAALLDAEVVFLDQLTEPFAAVYETLPYHSELRAFGALAPAYFQDGSRSRDERLALYHALLEALPLDATADAEGSSPHLGVEQALRPVAALGRAARGDAARAIADAEAAVAAGLGAHLVDHQEVSEQTYMVGEVGVVERRQKVFDVVRAVGSRFFHVDPKDAGKQLELEVDVPAAAAGRRRRLLVSAYNMWPSFFLEADWHPVDGGPPLRTVLRHDRKTFPGPVTEPTAHEGHHQALWVDVAPWALPAGRYRLAIRGRIIPGAYTGIFYGVKRVLLQFVAR